MAYALFALAAGLSSALSSEPKTLVITAPDQVDRIALHVEGTPVASEDFLGYAFLAGEHDYPHMVNVRPIEGGVSVSPTAACEMGTYTLVVRTRKGDARIDVRTPLTELPDTLENQAKAKGISVDELKKQLGLVTLGREVVSLSAPEVVYVGQPLPLALYSARDRWYTWLVNGEVVQDGRYEMTFSHIFKEPGEYLITYREREVHDGTTVTAASVMVHVAEFPQIPWDVPLNAPFELPGVEGYNRYTWTVDGRVISTDAVLKHRFSEPGPHRITLTATDAQFGPRDQFTRLHYAVTVE